MNKLWTSYEHSPKKSDYYYFLNLPSVFLYNVKSSYDFLFICSLMQNEEVARNELKNLFTLLQGLINFVLLKIFMTIENKGFESVKRGVS